MERVFNRRAAATIGNSLEVAGDLAAEGVAVDRIALIPNGVDAKRMDRR